MDPATISAMSSVAGKLFGSDPAAPQTATSGIGNAGGWLDSSGWTVATSGASAHGAIRTAAGEPGAGVVLGDTVISPTVLAAVAALVLVLVLKRRK